MYRNCQLCNLMAHFWSVQGVPNINMLSFSAHFFGYGLISCAPYCHRESAGSYVAYKTGTWTDLLNRCVKQNSC